MTYRKLFLRKFFSLSYEKFRVLYFVYIVILLTFFFTFRLPILVCFLCNLYILVPLKMLHGQYLRVKVKFNVFNTKKEYQRHHLQNRQSKKNQNKTGGSSPGGASARLGTLRQLWRNKFLLFQVTQRHSVMAALRN